MAADGRRGPLRPAEGWLTLLVLSAMLLIVALAVDDARWAGYRPNGESQTAFLTWTMLLAGGWGFVSAKLRWPVSLAHVVGATLGAGYVIVAVAGVISDAADPLVRLAHLDASVALFLFDVIVRQVRSDQTSAFLLLIGVIAWASGQFAGFAVFRHHRPMSAVMLLGLVLLVSMCLTVRNQFWYLVLYSGAALLLLVRHSLFEQRVLGTRSGFGDARLASALYLRNGAAFVALAVVGSLLLTANASSAPLAGLWRNADDQLVELGTVLDRYLGGVTGAVRAPGGLFAASQTLTGVWTGSPTVVFTATSDNGQGYYWRAATYDDFDGQTWRQSDRVIGPMVQPGDPILADTADAVIEGTGRALVTFTITPGSWSGDQFMAPEAPYLASRPVSVQSAGAGGPFDSITLTSPVHQGESIQVSSLVPVEGDAGITGNRLAVTGRIYPEWARRYVEIRPGSIGPIVAQTADRVVSTLPPDQRDPYHIAQALQDYLYSSGGFTYDTNVQDVCAGSSSAVDCLLQHREGYCQYFASALVMMLRTQQIPARYVVGYLPGRADPRTGVFTVTQTAAHAWVEVYFPAYGWLRFDPTPGNHENGQAATELPAGPRVPTPAPDASRGSNAEPSFVSGGSDSGAGARSDGSGRGSAGGGSGGQTPTNPLLLLGAIAVAAAAVGAVLWGRRRRSWLPTPEGAWVALTGLATRLGYGPRPTQTVYEYADTLGDALPDVRPELHVVARARVEATYGRHAVTGERLTELRQAYSRLRRSLLRLVLMRRDRRP